MTLIIQQNGMEWMLLLKTLRLVLYPCKKEKKKSILESIVVIFSALLK